MLPCSALTSGTEELNLLFPCDSSVLIGTGSALVVALVDLPFNIGGNSGSELFVEVKCHVSLSVAILWPNLRNKFASALPLPPIYKRIFLPLRFHVHLSFLRLRAAASSIFALVRFWDAWP